MADTDSPAEILPEGYKSAPVRPGQKYMLPSNDEEEADRLNSQHYLLRNTLHGNHTAPVEDLLEDGIKVLDVGCGPGQWTLDMASDYPQSTFVGVDMVDVFPTNDLPQNCSFVKGNTLERLPFDDNSFDYVFQR